METEGIVEIIEVESTQEMGQNSTSFVSVVLERRDNGTWNTSKKHRHDISQQHSQRAKETKVQVNSR